MDNTIFDLKQIHNDYTYSDDIMFINHLLLLIPTNEYSTIYWQMIHQLEEEELTYEKFKNQLRAFFEREIENKYDKYNYKKGRILKAVNNSIKNLLLMEKLPEDLTTNKH